MQLLLTLNALRSALPQPAACVFVPTMGNLHEGHLALVRHAQQHGLPVVVSVFVNRLQFAPHEDFDQYPRTLERDLDLLRSVGADILFAPTEAELYPQPQAFTISPDPLLADILEGHFRPGFFTGVCTVVMKLLQCVQPRVAVFGKKDYQQLKVITRMAEQFALPVKIEGLDTHRAADGLALSSRNAYLSTAQRAQATALHQALQRLVQQWPNPCEPSFACVLEAQARDALTNQGWLVDYLTVRRRDNLLAPSEADPSTALVALGAAKLGTTRLIDNVEFVGSPCVKNQPHQGL
jgi:pantoate--beta-alanine ligase